MRTILESVPTWGWFVIGAILGIFLLALFVV